MTTTTTIAADGPATPAPRRCGACPVADGLRCAASANPRLCELAARTPDYRLALVLHGGGDAGLKVRAATDAAAACPHAGATVSDPSCRSGCNDRRRCALMGRPATAGDCVRCRLAATSPGNPARPLTPASPPQ